MPDAKENDALTESWIAFFLIPELFSQFLIGCKKSEQTITGFQRFPLRKYHSSVVLDLNKSGQGPGVQSQEAKKAILGTDSAVKLFESSP